MMKKITLYISLVAAGMMVFTACKKETEYTAPYTLSTDMAFLRVMDAAPNFRAMYGVPDSFNVYVNGGKINSPFFTYNTVFPQSTTNFGYVAVPTGLQQIKMSVHGFASASPDSTQILNATKVFNAGQYYTWVITDSVKKYLDISFVPDTYTKPLNGNINLRLMHAVINDTTGKLVDIFSYARNNTIITNVAPGIVTPFAAFGFNAGVADTFYVTRPAAAGTPLANRIVLAKVAMTAVNQRTYTLYYKGDGNLSTGTKARSLSTFAH